MGPGQEKHAVVHQVQTSPLDDHLEQLHFDTVHMKEDSRDEIFASLNKTAEWDQGATGNTKGEG